MKSPPNQSTQAVRCSGKDDTGFLGENEGEKKGSIQIGYDDIGDKNGVVGGNIQNDAAEESKEAIDTGLEPASEIAEKTKTEMCGGKRGLKKISP
eukprot:3242022-Ditylum_brightwellii.AAC.1